MKLSPRQQQQIFFIIIEEAQRLAIKFGLSSSLDTLLSFKNSAEMNRQEILVGRFEHDAADTKARDLLKKTFRENENTLLRIISALFAIKPSKSSVIKLKHVIDLSEKALKKLPGSLNGEFNSSELNDYVRNSIKEYIKVKFGVSRKDIRDARALLEKKLSAKSDEALAAISGCARLPLLLLKEQQPHNFNYHGIQINGLYKLINIFNGIENKEIARSLLHFFSVDSPENRQIMQAFFTAEKTGQYCRLPTMLIQILSLLVSHHELYDTVSERFIGNILTQSGKTNIDSLLATPDDVIRALFNELFESALSIHLPFNHILAVARVDIEERAQQINELNATQDIFLRSMFYFVFVSPLLDLIESKLQKHNVWQSQDVQKLKLELSTAFHLMFGMNSDITTSSRALQELVTAAAIQKQVALTFASAVEAGPGEHTLFAAKRSSSGSAASSFVHDDGQSIVTNESPRSAYPSPRTMSFCSKADTSDGSSSSSIHSLRTRPKSGLFDKKPGIQAASSIKVPPLALDKVNWDDDTLERYFHHLFVCDAATTTQFVLSLVKPKDKIKLPWGVKVLNEASARSNKQIAEALMTHLSAAELLDVCTELFRIESSDSWCRGNKLLPQLVQYYLAHPDQKAYKSLIWDTVFILSDSLSAIDLSMGEADTFSQEYFDSKQAEIETIQNGFASALNNMLSPKHFPVFMRDLLQMGYADLLRREELNGSDDALLRQLLAFILIRFINPIILQEAQGLTDLAFKTWYVTIMPSAIQSLASPLVTSARSSESIPSIRALIFDPVTKNARQRKTIYQMLSSELNLDNSTVTSSAGRPLTGWDSEQSKRELNDLLKQEQFSGLCFKSSGKVTPRRDTPRLLASTLFDPASPSSSLSLSSSLGSSSTPPFALEDDADHERGASSGSIISTSP